MSIKCTKPELLKPYLVSLGAIQSIINDAERYKFECGLIVDVFSNTTVRFQNEPKNPELVSTIKTHIDSLNKPIN